MKFNRRRICVIMENFMERLGRRLIDTWRTAKRRHRHVKRKEAFREWLIAEPGSQAERKACEKFQALETKRWKQ